MLCMLCSHLLRLAPDLHAAVTQAPSPHSDDYDKVNSQVLKFKEKNRAAQRRYRERQKVGHIDASEAPGVR